MDELLSFDDILANNNLTGEQKKQAIEARSNKYMADLDRQKWLDIGRGGLGSVISGYSFHPVLNIPYVGTGLGGAMYEAGQAITEGKKLPEIAKRAGTGFFIGETVGAIPYAGKYANKLSGGKIGNVVNKGLEKVNPLVDKVKSLPAVQKIEDALMTDVTGKYIKGYHGTPNKFDKFDFNMVGTTTDDGMLGNGIYFTAYPDVAQTYAKNNGSVKKAILDFKNPFILENKKQLDEINAIIEPKIPSNTIEDIKNGTKLYSQAFKNYLEEQGYDSVIDNIGREGEQYVAFYPEQIKSNLFDYLANNSVLTKGYRQNKAVADKMLLNPSRKMQADINPFSKSNKNVMYDSPDDFIDLTNSFDSTPTMEEVKNFLRESAKTGKKFETSSPDYFLDVLDSSKKIDHIAKSSNFKTMNKSQKKRHNKYVLAFDDISKTLKKNGEGVANTKPDKKPNVKNYHEFNTTAKFNENNYPLTVYAEQLINEPDTIPQTYHLYDILENKKSPSANSLKSVNLGDDTNIITDNLDNVNPSAGLYEKIVDNSVNLQKPIPKGYMRLYRGLQEEFNPNYDKSKLDNVNGYESWTDNYDLAKAYGDNVYYIDIPENTIAKSIIDENPKSMTYGDRHLIYEHDKPVGIKDKSGKEYMLYTYHDNYPNIKYNKI